MNIKIKKLSQNAITPTYGTEGAACFDLYSLEDGDVSVDSPKVFKTGVSFEVPENHVMLVFSRSGQGFKDDVRLSNCVGVVDSDYRGEVKVKLAKDYSDPYEGAYYVSRGDRIAQAMIIPVNQVNFEVVGELSDTQRGVKGYGSTGK